MVHNFGTFRPEFEKTIVIFEIITFDFVKMQSLMLKNSIWDQNHHIWVFLDWSFSELLSCFKSLPSEFVKMESFM